jgi:hypothetical protein
MPAMPLSSRASEPPLLHLDALARGRKRGGVALPRVARRRGKRHEGAPVVGGSRQDPAAALRGGGMAGAPCSSNAPLLGRERASWGWRAGAIEPWRHRRRGDGRSRGPPPQLLARRRRCGLWEGMRAPGGLTKGRRERMSWRGGEGGEIKRLTNGPRSG